VENNFNFVKDAPMIYVTFIATEIVVSAEKKAALLPYRP
jgi:hypothetical protein